MTININNGPKLPYLYVDQGQAFKGTIIAAEMRQDWDFDTRKPLWWGPDRKPTTDNPNNDRNPVESPRITFRTIDARGAYSKAGQDVQPLKAGDEVLFALSGASKRQAFQAAAKAGWNGDLSEGTEVVIKNNGTERNQRGNIVVKYDVKCTAPVAKIDLADPFGSVDASTGADEIPF